MVEADPAFCRGGTVGEEAVALAVECARSMVVSFGLKIREAFGFGDRDVSCGLRRLSEATSGLPISADLVRGGGTELLCSATFVELLIVSSSAIALNLISDSEGCANKPVKLGQSSPNRIRPPFVRHWLEFCAG